MMSLLLNVLLGIGFRRPGVQASEIFLEGFMTPGFVSVKSLVCLYPLLHVVNFMNL